MPKKEANKPKEKREKIDIRDAKGHLAPGCCINPQGISQPKGWQPYGLRSKHWLQKLSRGELKALAANEVELDKLSSYDAMIIVHLVGTMNGKDKGRERDRLLNRIEGMPVQTIVTEEKDRPSQEDIDKLSEEEAERMFDKELKG